MDTDEIAWETLLEQHDSDDAFVAIVDSDFVLRAASPAIGGEVAVDPSEVIGTSAADLIHPDDMLRALHVFQGKTAGDGRRPQNIYRIRTSAAETHRSFSVTSETVLDGAAVVLRLEPPSRRARSELLALEQIDVFEMMSNGRPLDDCLLALAIMIERDSDNSLAIIHVADDAQSLRPIASKSLPAELRTRYEGASLNQPGGELQSALAEPVIRARQDSSLGFPTMSATAVRRPAGELAGYLELLHPAGHRYGNAELSLQRAAARLIGLVIDRYVTESHLADADLIDDLTGLPSRQALLTTADELEKDRRSYGLMTLDLDGFAALNTAGHQVGDRALAEVAHAIRSALPPEATAYRLGGDEFVVLVPDERRAESLASLGQTIIDEIGRTHIDLAGTTDHLGLSIGVAMSSGRQQPFTEVLGRADTAMRVAKRDGGNQVRLHDQPLDSRWVHRRALADSLPNALKTGELHLEFQPIISLTSHYAVGFEALSRWQHPRFGMLSPGDFLPIAEETSLIHAVDTWVLDTAASRVGAWNQASRGSLDLWVNLSARSLARPDLIGQILDLQERHGLQIGVELTERDSFASGLHADEACRQLGDAGIKLALDDFGAGRASLYRAVFHGPSVLKIDRSLVHGMLESERTMAMVSTILDIGQRLDLRVIAEGVETEQQMQQLELMGCEFAQGYLFAPPLPGSVIERRLGPSFDDLRVVRLSTPS